MGVGLSLLNCKPLERKDLALFLCLSSTSRSRDYVCNQWLLKRHVNSKLHSTILFLPFSTLNSHGQLLPRPDSVGNSRTENPALAKPVLLFFLLKEYIAIIF